MTLPSESTRTLVTPEHRLVLIGGMHRSGTTLFGRCLAKHPEASGFEDTEAIEDEGQFLQSVYRPARAYGGPGRFGWDARSHLTEESELATTSSRARLLEEWAPHWRLERRVLIEKSPPNLLKTRFFARLFPEAWQVMVLRHPVACCLATKKWAKGTSVARLLEHWVHCHELLRRDAEHVDRLIVIAYESFVADADAAMRTVDEVLGLSPHVAALEVREGINDKYFEEFRRRLEGVLSRWSLRRALRGLEPRVNALGYSLEDLGRGEVERCWGEVARVGG